MASPFTLDKNSLIDKTTDGIMRNLQVAVDAIRGLESGSPVSALPAGAIAPDAVTTAKILDSAVTTAKLADDAVTSAKLDPSTIQYAEVSLTKANILALATTPITVVPAVTGYAIEIISAIVIHDYDTAAYTGGGDIVLGYTAGGTTLTSTISAANSFGAGADKITQCLALDTADGIALATTAVVIRAASDFTDPGTAAGVGRVKVAYRLHATGL